MKFRGCSAFWTGSLVKLKNMKSFFGKITLFAVLLFLSSCANDNTTPTPPEEVTAATIAGTWKLVEWNNGEKLHESTYCYIEFNRRDKTFKMYMNINSMYAQCVSGDFFIDKDPRLGYIISGNYAFGNGDWNHEYIVTDFKSASSMSLVAKDDKNDVCKYVRCESVPQEIVDAARQPID